MDLNDLNLDALRPVIPLPKLIKVLTLCAVAASIFIGYYFVLWTPLQAEITSEESQVASQQALLTKNKRLASNIPQKKEEYKKLQVQLKIALNMLPKKSQIPDLLEDVTWSGKDSGLAFTSFRPGKEVIKSIHAEVPVAFSVVGGFKQLLTFLKRVGEMSRIVDVKNLKVLSKDGVLSIDGQAVTYRFVESKTKPKKRKRR